MSWPKAFSVASTTAAVPGVKVVTQRVISRSPRSAMWSLCRWVSSRADKPLAPRPIAGPHQGGRPSAIRVGDRTAGTEQRDFDHGFRHVTDPGRLPVN